MKFVDEITFAVGSGHGGAGAVSFIRERFIPRGGPDGGDGGRGGDLTFRATTSRNTLVDYRFNKKYYAEPGEPGGARQCTGRSGQALELLVPVGTTITDEATDEALADLDHDGAEFTLRGGRGGRGNAFFKTSTHRTPRVAQPGIEGVELRVRLELKLIADVGLLGFPNAGKSTLISRISSAKPKIADYPFTTLVPNLGVVQLGEGTSFVVADIPGLIHGAAQGVGLGHAFLRHLDRCALFVHLVPADADDPIGQYKVLNAELQAYDPELATRPQLVVLSKVDVLPDDERDELLQQIRDTGAQPMPLSSVSGAGVQALVGALWKRLNSPDAP